MSYDYIFSQNWDTTFQKYNKIGRNFDEVRFFFLLKAFCNQQTYIFRGKNENPKNCRHNFDLQLVRQYAYVFMKVLLVKLLDNCGVYHATYCL